MSRGYYDEATADLREYLEDHGQEQLLSVWDLQEALVKVLFKRFRSRNIPVSIAAEAATDEAIAIVNNLDTIRPVLEAYWETN